MTALRADLLVVGASFAGLACARAAAARGMDVLVVERDAEIAARLRTTGILMEEAVRWLRPPHALLLDPITRLRLISPGGQLLDLASPTARFYSCDTRGLLRWLAERAREQGARFLTGAAFEGQIGQSAYAASKNGVIGLNLPGARELARHGIRVNAIAPGLFATPMAISLGEKVVASLTERIEGPKRLGRPEEFAQCCRFLVENAYINGETIRLDAATRHTAR